MTYLDNSGDLVFTRGAATLTATPAVPDAGTTSPSATTAPPPASTSTANRSTRPRPAASPQPPIGSSSAAKSTPPAPSGYFEGRLCAVALYTEALDGDVIAAGADPGGGTAGDADDVLTSDGAGGTVWAPPNTQPKTKEPTSPLAPNSTSSGTGITATTTPPTTKPSSPSPPATPPNDTLVWMPLTTVTGGVPELVWDANDDLIPTLVPI